MNLNSLPMIPNPFDRIDSRLSNIESILLDIKQGAREVNLTPVIDPPLTVSQAASFLNLKEQTVRKLCRERLLPCMKAPGQKRVYFLKPDLIEYLKKSRRKTASEIKEIALNATPKRGRAMAGAQ